jgi:integrase
METTHDPRSPSAPTLRVALARAIRDARANGSLRITLRGTYVYPSRALLRHMPDMARRPFVEVDVERVRQLVRDCIELGLLPRTVCRSYLWLLQRAFDLADLPSPVGEAKRRMKAILRGRAPDAAFFATEELHGVLDRIANHRARKPLVTRAEDLAIFRLAGLRGIRAGEMERIRIERDIDWRGLTVSIISKDREAPRTIDLSPALVQDLRVLAGGRTSGPLIRGGARKLNVVCERWKRRLDEPRLNLRNLRRSFASALDAQGAPLSVLRDALGHVRDSTQTLRYVSSTRRRRISEYARLEHGGPPVLA